MNRNDTQLIKEALSALADNELDTNEQITEAELIELACKDQDAMLSWQCAHLTRDVLQADYTSALGPDFAARISDHIAAEASLQIDMDDYHRDAGQVVSIADARDRTARGNYARERSARSAYAVRGAASVGSTSMQNEPFKLWKPVAGLGLAASLAGATLLFSQIWQTEQPDGALVADVSSSAIQAQPVAIQDDTSESNDVQTLQASVRMENRGTRWRMDSDLPRNKQIEQRLNTLLTNHLEDARMGRVTGMMSHSRVVGYDSVPGDQ